MADLAVKQGNLPAIASKALQVLRYATATGSTLLSSLAVAATAVALAIAHIEFQYVIGGLVIVFAQRLAMKPIRPQVDLTVPGTASSHPYRDYFDKEGASVSS